MENSSFQVLVIGSGPGGYVAAIRAAQLGFKVACVEKMDTLGGTCLNIGCIPSKALLQSSESFDWIQKSSKEQGVNVSGVSFDFSAMMKRKDEIVGLLVGGVASHFKKHQIVRLKGSAKFISANEIEVDGKSYKADNFILATGSVPIALPFLPFDEKRVLSSTGALALNDVPKTMVVIGAGAIGVELASVYSRLGTKITIIEMLPVVTPAMDPALSKQLLQSLKKQGIDFLLEAKVASAKVNDKSVTLKVEHENNTLTIEAEVVLVCIGRKAFTEGLNLEAAAVATNPKGMIAVDANFRTSQSHIYAIGDVIDGPMLAHKASHEGIAVSEIIAGKTPHLNYMAIPNVVYTHPEVASVGMTESEAKAAGLDLLIGTSYFRGNGRARCSGDFEGFVKVIGDVKSGRLLGMHIIGAHASELIAEGMVAIEKKATLVDLASACHAHPTLSETIMEASQQALGYAIHG